jgi:peptidoglycan/xylan/chitin deacetylase (PgdA/CDA1 family)
MIKPKRQEKVIYKAAKKKTAKKFPLLQILMVELIIGLFVAAIVSAISIPETQIYAQNAEPVNDTRDLNLYNPTLLPTEEPLPSPVLPFEDIQNLNTPASESSTLSNASPSATPQLTPADYCINVPVILYHHIQPLEIASQLGHEPLTVDSNIFDEQIKYLKEHNYHAATADELVQALENHISLPDKSVLITIDDGYDDNYTYAFLTAKKYQFVMNFMIPTELIGKPGYMNWDHLREMHSSDYARIYNHTATHAALGQISQNEIDNELATSSADFKRELGLETNIFTYPYGSYNPLAIDELKRFGFIAGFTTDPGRQECLSNIMLLKRVRVGNAPISSYGF